MPFLVILVFVHLWGTRTNRRKMRAWARTHLPVMQREFAIVGVSKDADQGVISKLQTSESVEVPDGLVRMKTPSEWISYATGRQNAAFVDIKLNIAKRYNPLARLTDVALGLISESTPAPRKRWRHGCIHLTEGKND